jgi:hypothetical protein
MADTPLHPALQPISFLLGTWRGEGQGHYPTVDDFVYAEESRFWTTGRAVIHYEQQTWSPATGAPMHCESGYLRMNGNRVEMMLAHPLGIVEIEEGQVAGRRLKLTTVNVGRSSTAKRIDSLARTIAMDGDELAYTLEMAAVGQPLAGHLSARLKRVRAPGPPYSSMVPEIL